MAEIAVGLNAALQRRDRLGEPGRMHARVIAKGPGWRVSDVLCTCGRDDNSYEERHAEFAVAFVLAGTFEQCSVHGRQLMAPGSTMLGTPGADFKCTHTHGRGDRCLSFFYSPAYFDRLVADAGARSAAAARFPVAALPPLRSTASMVSQAAAWCLAPVDRPWSELATCVAARVVGVAARETWTPSAISAGTERKVADAVHAIEQRLDEPLTLDLLASQAGLSPYHFLRTFTTVCGVTPHQYVRRTRLSRAAARLIAEKTRVIDIALESGFGDVSNFNRAFREEFGVSPRRYRRDDGVRTE